jgi:hypothetical protein
MPCRCFGRHNIVRYREMLRSSTTTFSCQHFWAPQTLPHPFTQIRLQEGAQPPDRRPGFSGTLHWHSSWAEHPKSREIINIS